MKINIKINFILIDGDNVKIVHFVSIFIKLKVIKFE